MKIFYDDQAFNNDNKFGGIARCFIEVIKRMPCDVFVSVIYSKLYYISSINPKIRDVFGNTSFRGKRKIRQLLNKINTYINLLCKKYDLIHITGEAIYPKWLVKAPVVITIHDCIPEKIFQKGKPLPQRLVAMNYATRIVAVSENTKKDILNYYPSIPADKITVIYHGVNNFEKALNTNIYGRYLLYVGARSSRYKNFDNCVKALHDLFKEDKDIRLICAGNPFNGDEVLLIEQLGLKGRVISMECTDEQLVILYSHALAFIYPSKYEGFGIPILEAWRLNCPVILSNTSCFPEIAGNAGMYFDPMNVKDIEHAIRTVIYDEKKREELIELGRKRVELFSWDDAAKKLMLLYEDILGYK